MDIVKLNCYRCGKSFPEAKLRASQDGKGYHSKTVYYYPGCVEINRKRKEIREIRTKYRKSAYARSNHYHSSGDPK